MAEGVFLEALARAWAAFRSHDTTTGLEQVHIATMERPRHGEAWYLRALLLEQQGHVAAADRCFHRAAVAGEKPQMPPFRVPWSRFTAMVEETCATLPDAIQAVLGEVAIIVANYPLPHQRVDTEDEILACFEGHLRSEREQAEFGDQPRIILFRRAHEHACASAAELAAQIRITLIEEFACYLGYDQDALERLSGE